ncbi:putative membrane protein [Lachnospiraceae bacterium JC7]|nr:putative membrane protein [Lachnospiraceae bacterium JC7]
MELIFIAIGIASLAYDAAIFVNHGLTAFMWFWPLFAFINFVMFGLVRYLKHKNKEKKEINLRPFIFAFTSYGLCVSTLAVLLLVIFCNAATVEQKNLDYVIVLGTDLVDNKISKSLKRRLDRAIEYGRENPNTVFVLSGGRSDYDRSTEATVMYHYMIKEGVPEKNLLLEFYSDSTQEKVGFSLRTIKQDYEQKMLANRVRHNSTMDRRNLSGNDIIIGVERPLSIGIITSEFNLFRAGEIAKKYGFPDACPMATKTDELMLVHLATREAVALFKDRLIGNI